MSNTIRPLVAAVGDVNRHDYGVGAAVLQHLAGRGLDVTLVDRAESTLTDLCHGHELAIVVDPVLAEPCHPGRVHRIVMARPDPGRLIVFAVETADTDDGPGLSPAVAAAARRVADAIAAEIGDLQTPRRDPATRWPFAHRAT